MRVGGGHTHQRVVVHAVVAALELQDLVAPAIGAGGAEGIERSLSAAAAEANHIAAGDGADNLFGEQDSLVVVGKECCAFLDLLARRLNDFWVGVANQHWA